jgi:hypothetical protein
LIADTGLILVISNAYRLIVILSVRFVFTLTNLTFQILHIDSFSVFRDRSQFPVKASIFEDSKRQHVRRSYYPYIPCIYWVSEILEQASQILRCTTGDTNALFGDGIGRLVEVRQPLRNVSTKPWVARVGSIAHGRIGNRLVLEHIVGCFVKQLCRQQRYVRPSDAVSNYSGPQVLWGRIMFERSMKGGTSTAGEADGSQVISGEGGRALSED